MSVSSYPYMMIIISSYDDPCTIISPTNNKGPLLLLLMMMMMMMVIHPKSTKTMAETTFQLRKIAGKSANIYLCLLIEHDWEKFGSVNSKYSANLMGSTLSASNLAENPQKMADSGLQELWLFGCIRQGVQ